MNYVELAFTAPEAAADEWVARLHEAGAAGVEVRDGETLEKAPPGSTVLVVWVAPETVEDLRPRASALPVLAPRARRERVARAVEGIFQAAARGPLRDRAELGGLHAAADEIRLDLDPGRAFGTGQHASTRLCLELLGRLPPVSSFLDVGCGSGVLAIAAKKAWPQARGAAMDIDPEAVEVSRENAARNHVELALSTELPDGVFDLVLANIQPEVLIPLAPKLTGRVGRTLILSGILVEAAGEVARAYPSLKLVETRDDEGWRALVMSR